MAEFRLSPPWQVTSFQVGVIGRLHDPIRGLQIACDHALVVANADKTALEMPELAEVQRSIPMPDGGTMLMITAYERQTLGVIIVTFVSSSEAAAEAAAIVLKSDRRHMPGTVGLNRHGDKYRATAQLQFFGEYERTQYAHLLAVSPKAQT